MRAAILALVCLTQQASQPNILNGRLDTQAAGSNLQAVFQRLVAAQTEPAWIGYTVPTTIKDPSQRLCCGGDTWISDGIVFTNGRLAACGLEPGERTARTAQG